MCPSISYKSLTRRCPTILGCFPFSLPLRRRCFRTCASLQFGNPAPAPSPGSGPICFPLRQKSPPVKVIIVTSSTCSTLGSRRGLREIKGRRSLPSAGLFRPPFGGSVRGSWPAGCDELVGVAVHVKPTFRPPGWSAATFPRRRPGLRTSGWSDWLGGCPRRGTVR